MKIAHRPAVATLVALLGLAGCGEDRAEPARFDPRCEPIEAEVEESLRWRRAPSSFEQLGRALHLEPDALCEELEGASCTELHLVSLGGNDPFEPTLYTPIAVPIPTTPVAVDRVALGACHRRVELDRAGEALVFEDLDLSADRVDPRDPTVEATVVGLFRRIHGRDPSAAEVDIVAALARDTTPASFATLACFTISTTTEFVLF